MRADVATSYVRDLLEQVTGERPSPDQDGDLPVDFGGARFFVRVAGDSDAWIQVFSVALADVVPSAELMAHLNQINSQLRFVRAFHVSDQILIEADIWADDINPANLHHACTNVALATDSFARKLLDLVGGRPTFEESKTEEYRAPLGFMGSADLANFKARYTQP